MKRDFASLSPQEGLHVAIFIEERNAELYHNFAEMFADFGDQDSLAVARAFEEMAQQERHHGSRLQDRYFARYGTRACSVTEEDIRDLIEVPRLESVDLLVGRRAGASPSRRKAFAVALAAENEAAGFYRQLAESATEPELRAFYQEFVKMESEHSAWLEARAGGTVQEAGGSPSA